MSVLRPLTYSLVFAAALAGCSPPRSALDTAAANLDTANVQAIEFSGNGQWFQFGQSAAPGAPWPRFDVSSYTASIDYAAPAARVQVTRTQTVEAGRERPAPVEQKVDQYVAGTTAWNVPTAPPAGGGAAQPTSQPAAVEERLAEIWTTPQGFIKAAQANRATAAAVARGMQLTFTKDGRSYEGFLDADGNLTRVRTQIDNPVLGDTPMEVNYSQYQKFGTLTFPTRITRTLGGHPVLDLTVTAVTAQPAAALSPPAELSAPTVEVTAETLAPGVHYLKGGSHHSVAIEQAEGIVVVEGPQHEQRGLAVIAKVKELIPNKPIRFVVNSHHHFDHSGGLRPFVAEGATVVTHEANRSFYEQAWANPRKLNPDRLDQSGNRPQFQTFTDKLVLADDRHPVEVHHIAGNGHNDAFAMVYLPKERILIEGDAWTPAAAGAPAPATPNPYTVNLLDNVERLKLDVRQIAALHGPRVAPLQELRAAAGR
jgi:glyoxylase-like metal-dependent hydrolase (beta-lactamase superfamily II)